MCLPTHTRTHRACERNRGDESSSDYNPPHVEIINERLLVCCLYRAELLDNHQGRQTPNNFIQVRLKRGGHVTVAQSVVLASSTRWLVYCVPSECVYVNVFTYTYTVLLVSIGWDTTFTTSMYTLGLLVNNKK